MKPKAIPVSKFAPNWKRACEVCGQTPCVNAEDDKGAVVYRGSMCGPCTWGEVAMSDPAKWNKGETP